MPQNFHGSSRAGSRALALLLLTVACGLLAGGVQAQAKNPGLNGSEALDFVTGPVIGSGRIVGLGGAYTALAVGADGAAWNPASYATRNLWALNWFEWDLAFDYSAGAFRSTDFDHNGQIGAASNNTFLTLGGRLGFGAFGVGGLLRLQYYNLGQGAQLQLAVGNYGVGYALLDGQLVIGLAARTAALTIVDHSGSTLVDFAGTGPEAGAILGLADRPYRIGLSARLAVHAEPASSQLVAAGLTLPKELVLPAEVQLGMAYQLGVRPLNRRFVDPHQAARRLKNDMLARRAGREREQLERESQAAHMRSAADTDAPVVATEAAARQAAAAAAIEPGEHPRDVDWWVEESRSRWLEDQELARAINADEAFREDEVKRLSRRYLLLSTEAILLGMTSNGIGLESFLAAQRQTSGRYMTLGVRFGAEGEPIPGRLIMRVGSYLEPSRFAGVGYRAHATVAIDLRLFAWDVFGLLDEFNLRVSAYGDVASLYNSLGVGIGLWH